MLGPLRASELCSHMSPEAQETGYTSAFLSKGLLNVVYNYGRPGVVPSLPIKTLQIIDISNILLCSQRFRKLYGVFLMKNKLPMEENGGG